MPKVGDELTILLMVLYGGGFLYILGIIFGKKGR